MFIVISLAIAIWVARTLHRRGPIYVVDAFHRQEDLADLLAVGLHLINVGYVAFALRTS
jgi:hypothetical protein